LVTFLVSVLVVLGINNPEEVWMLVVAVAALFWTGLGIVLLFS